MTHPFERAGLGVAPFHVAGFEVKLFQAAPGAEVRAGASCDYCGTAIANVFWIMGSDARRFKVGSDCVYKTADKGLIDRVKNAERKIARDKRHARGREAKAEVEAALADSAVREKLAAICHPKIPGKTMLDYFEFLVRFSGTTGKIKARKLLEDVLKAVHVEEARGFRKEI